MSKPTLTHKPAPTPALETRSMALPEDWNLPAAIRSRLGEGLGKQRAMFADGHLLLILHKAPTTDHAKREAVAFWRDPRGNWRVTGPGDGAVRLRAHLDEHEKRIDQLDAETEVASDATAWFTVLQHVVPLHRAVKNLHDTLQSAREMTGDDREIITLRDRSADMERTVELVHADVKNALDYTIAKEVEEHARIGNELHRFGQRISLMAAIFLPVTALAGIFGMNLQSGFERSGPWAFWLILGVGVMVGVGLSAMIAAGGRPVRPARTKNPKIIRQAKRY